MIHNKILQRSNNYDQYKHPFDHNTWDCILDYHCNPNSLERKPDSETKNVIKSVKSKFIKTKNSDKQIYVCLKHHSPFK